MKKFITFLLWVFALTSLVFAYFFASFYMIQIDDFTTKDGVIRGELDIAKNEYGDDVSLKFYIEGDDKKYSLAGKLLKKADADIYKLKAGDAIRIWLKKEEAKHFFDRSLARLAIIWGIQRVDGPVLLSLETAVAYRKSSQSLVYMAIFLVMGFSMLFYVLKRSKR